MSRRRNPLLAAEADTRTKPPRASRAWSRLLPAAIWVPLFAASIPALHSAMQIQPSDPLPPHWHLPETIGEWQGEPVYYSTDPQVARSFTSEEIIEPGVCPVSGKPLDTISPAERRLLPPDVDIRRRLYRDGSGLRRTAILLISGTSREGIHRPDWCLKAQGFQPGRRRVLAARDAAGQPFEFGVYPMIPAGAPADDRTRSFFLYWFEGPNIRTPYHGERIIRMGLDRVLSGKVQRWLYASVQVNLSYAETLDPDPVLVETAQWLRNGMDPESRKPQNIK